MTKDFVEGTPEWDDAYRAAVRQLDRLEEAHRSGEIVVEMGTDGVLRRGAQMDTIPQLRQSE